MPISDLAAFSQRLFTSPEPVHLEFRLPADPYTIYQKGLVPIEQALELYKDDDYDSKLIAAAQRQGTKFFNLCSDVENNSEDDYWYFWNPDQPNCPRATADATVTIAGLFTPLANTTVTYPEYDRLVHNGVLKIKYLVGLDDDGQPGDSTGIQSFAKAFHLLTMGKGVLDLPESKITLTDGERRLLEETADADDVKFTIVNDQPRAKTLSYRNGKYRVEIDMELWDPTSDAFGDAAIDGMRHDDVFIYDGHSGLGDYLGTNVLFEDGEKLDTTKYQVFYFNGCSTYSYYNVDYFDMKKTPKDPLGTKNLDVLTTSIEADIVIAPGSDVWLIRSLADGKLSSWQSTLDNIYAVDPKLSPYTQINGDEDNPTTPPRF